MARQAKRGGDTARNRWSADEARAVVAAWERSGKSGAAFARSIGVVPQRLFWWRRRLSTAAPEAPAFVPVVTTSFRSSTAALVVTTAKGVRIEVSDVDATTAAWVIAVLGSGADS